MEAGDREFFGCVSDSGMRHVLYTSMSLSSILFMLPLLYAFLNDSIVGFRLITNLTPRNLIEVILC
jgi:hypothetical protein